MHCHQELEQHQREMYGRASNTCNRLSLANYLTLIFGEILLQRKSGSVHKMVLFSSEVVNIGFRVITPLQVPKKCCIKHLEVLFLSSKTSMLKNFGFHKFLLSNFGKILCLAQLLCFLLYSRLAPSSGEGFSTLLFTHL